MGGKYSCESCEYGKRIADAAREEGRREERADVVKWLWGCVRFARAAGGEAMALRASALEDEAEAIERGDHVGAAGKKGKL